MCSVSFVSVSIRVYTDEARHELDLLKHTWLIDEFEQSLKSMGDYKGATNHLVEVCPSLTTCHTEKLKSNNRQLNLFMTVTEVHFTALSNYSGTPISWTLDFSKTQITQTKSCFPWICFTVILPLIFWTADFSNQIMFPLEVQEIGIPLYMQPK